MAGRLIRYAPIKRYTNLVERLGRKYGVSAVAMNIDKKTRQITKTEAAEVPLVSRKRYRGSAVGD